MAPIIRALHKLKSSIAVTTASQLPGLHISDIAHDGKDDSSLLVVEDNSQEDVF